MHVLGPVDWAAMFTPDTPLAEIVVRGSCIYLGLFLLLRFILRRESGTLGVTDVLVVVLIADAAQNGMADDYTAVPDGLLLVLVIIGWAWLLNALAYRFPLVERIVRPEKLPLVRDGRVIQRNMRREFITRAELDSQLREQGVHDVSEVRAVFMEADGRISVLSKDDEGSRGAPELDVH